MIDAYSGSVIDSVNSGSGPGKFIVIVNVNTQQVDLSARSSDHDLITFNFQLNVEMIVVIQVSTNSFWNA